MTHFDGQLVSPIKGYFVSDSDSVLNPPPSLHSIIFLPVLFSFEPGLNVGANGLVFLVQYTAGYPHFHRLNDAGVSEYVAHDVDHVFLYFKHSVDGRVL